MSQSRHNARFGGKVPSALGSPGQALVVNSGADGLEYANVSGSGGGGGSGLFASSSNAILKGYSQASNGFSVGDWVYLSGSSVVLASATSSAKAEPMLGVVSSAGDPEFEIVNEGEATVSSHGFTVGENLYLSASLNGEATTTAPLIGVYKQLGFVKDANTIYVRIGDTMEIGGNDTLRTYQEYSFSGDGSSVNFDLPINVANAETVLVDVGGVFQPASSYTIIGDGSGNPRRIQFSEAPFDGDDIYVRYLGVIEEVSVNAPVSSTDYNSGTPVALSLVSGTTLTNLQAIGNFVFAHGLGVIPKDVEVVLRCLDTEHGYSIGEELGIDSVEADSSFLDPYQAACISRDSTNVYVNLNRETSNSSYQISDRTSGDRVQIDLSKWGVVVYANAEMGGTNGVIQAVNTPATEFESAEVILGTNATTFKTNDNFTFAHGLVQKPKSVRPVLICQSAEHGYSVGDEVGFGERGSSNDVLMSLSADSTNVQVLFDTNASTKIGIIAKDDNNETIIDLTKWAVKVYANSELGGYKGDRGPAGTGKIAQIKYDEIIGPSDNTGVIPEDTTIPQSSEGHELLSVTITPKNPDSTLIIEEDIISSVNLIRAVFKDNEVNAFAAAGTSGGLQPLKIYIPASGTNTRTYKLKVGRPTAGTNYMNQGNAGISTFGNILRSTFTVTEILP